MKTTIHHKSKIYEIDLSQPIDISLPIRNTEQNPIAWYLDLPKIEPVISGDFIGSVRSGKSSTNFNTIVFNPHGHGTHTECLGHITRGFYSVNQVLKTFFFSAELISITPEGREGDLVITKKQIKDALPERIPESLIIRTLPNTESKRYQNYSHTNPPYMLEEAARYLYEIGIRHLLIDLPSVDKEKDEGLLLAHKAFWNINNTDQVNEDARFDCTITELVFIDDGVKDGSYILNLQIASFENDASPSKPLLYALI